MKHNISELNKDMQVLKALIDQPNSKIACLEMEIKEVKNKVDTKLDYINKNIEINNKFKCKVFALSFKYKEELKWHWLTTQVFCKTGQLCCGGSYSNESEFIDNDGIDHERDDWEGPENKCVECVFKTNVHII